MLDVQVDCRLRIFFGSLKWAIENRYSCNVRGPWDAATGSKANPSDSLRAASSGKTSHARFACIPPSTHTCPLGARNGVKKKGRHMLARIASTSIMSGKAVALQHTISRVVRSVTIAVNVGMSRSRSRLLPAPVSSNNRSSSSVNVAPLSSPQACENSSRFAGSILMNFVKFAEYKISRTRTADFASKNRAATSAPALVPHADSTASRRPACCNSTRQDANTKQRVPPPLNTSRFGYAAAVADDIFLSSYMFSRRVFRERLAKIRNRIGHTILDCHSWFPSKVCFCTRNIGLALFGIVDGRFCIFDSCFCARMYAF